MARATRSSCALKIGQLPNEEMIKEGGTKREIAEHLGFENDNILGYYYLPIWSAICRHLTGRPCLQQSHFAFFVQRETYRDRLTPVMSKGLLNFFLPIAFGSFNVPPGSSKTSISHPSTEYSICIVR